MLSGQLFYKFVIYQPNKMIYHTRIKKWGKFLVYGVSFIIISNAIIRIYLTQSRQTIDLFSLISFMLAFGTVVVYYVLILPLNHITNSISNLLDALLLYISSEIAFLFTGDCCCLFGIRYIFHWYTEEIDANILQLRINFEIVLSTSFMISAIIYFMLAQAFNNKRSTNPFTLKQ